MADPVDITRAVAAAQQQAGLAQNYAQKAMQASAQAQQQLSAFANVTQNFWQGEFDPTVTYNINHMVDFKAATYISLAPNNTGNYPDSSVQWQIVARKVQADWALNTPRWYAIDAAAGNDENLGYSDVSSALAGTVAKQTFAGLAAVLPKLGAGRQLVIRIAAGTYVGGLDTFLAGLSGYAGGFPLVLPTITCATAGCVKFDNSVADKIQAGFVNATGMNAAGYSIVSGTTQNSLKCTLVGGGSPSFPAETGIPIPMGVRARFVYNTSTTALQNVAVPIIALTASDTVGVCVNTSAGPMLPVTPNPGDVFVIEMPGVNCDGTQLGYLTNNTALRSSQDFGAPQIVGINFVGSTGSSFEVNGCALRLTGCMSLSCIAIRAQLNTEYVYSDETGTSRQVGMFHRSTGQVSTLFSPEGLNSNNEISGFVTAGAASFSHATALNISEGSVLGAGLGLFGNRCEVSNDSTNNQATSQIGGRTINLMSGIRILGTSQFNGVVCGTALVMSDHTFSKVDWSGLGAHPCIALFGRSSISVGDGCTSISGGNTDVGLDMTNAAGSIVLIHATSSPVYPTVTGSLGDVRFPDGSFHSWSSLHTAGVTTDTRGNTYIGC